MRIRKVELTPFRLVLREPLVTAAGCIEAREGVLVRLHGSADLEGFGEATPIAGFGMEGVRESWEVLSALAPQLVGEDVRELDALLDGIEAAASRAPAARAALDAAIHDLAAQASGCSIAAWIASRGGWQARGAVAVNALLSAREPGRLEAEAAQAAAAGFGTLKLKVAAGTLGEDIARLAAVRAAVGGLPRLRLDANGGWKEEEALTALERLACFGVELVEQPVDANDLLALARLRAVSPVRIAADESAAGVARAERVIALRAADAICLKLGATGGIRAALRLAERARSAGIEVFVTSGLDGAVARAAALQLAAALPGPGLACGLATGSLLRDDLATPFEPARGMLALPQGAGLGVVPDSAALSRLASGPSLEFEKHGA
jgi:o-succinylbenzoate synthase